MPNLSGEQPSVPQVPLFDEKIHSVDWLEKRGSETSVVCVNFEPSDVHTQSEHSATDWLSGDGTEGESKLACRLCLQPLAWTTEWICIQNVFHRENATTGRVKPRHTRLCYGNKWRIIYLLVIVSPVVGKERSSNSLNWLRREIKTQKDDFSLLQCFKVSYLALQCWESSSEAHWPTGKLSL